MITYIDIIATENRSISVTKRLPVNDGHVLLSQTPISYHVRCKAHDVKIEISALQAETVEDSISFCRHCLSGEPPIECKRDPLVTMQATMVQRAQANAATVDFINSLDI